MTEEDVEKELFDTILNRRSDLLKLAANSQSTQEHDGYTSEATQVLKMAERFLSAPERLNGARFSKLYGQIVYWIGFRKNSTDAGLRHREAALVEALLLQCDTERALEVIEVLIGQSDFIDFGDGTITQKKELREMCVSAVSFNAVTGAIEFFNREGGIRLLTERNRFIGVKFCLLNPESPVWKNPLRERLMNVISKGKSDIPTYENVREYFDLIVEGWCRASTSSINLASW